MGVLLVLVLAPEMPRTKKNQEKWEVGFRAAINSVGRGWGVLEHSDKVRLRLQFPKGGQYPPNQAVTLPFGWERDSIDPVRQLVALIFEEVNSGKKTLRNAINEVIAKSDARQRDPSNWAEIMEAFHIDVTTKGNRILEATYKASYGRYFKVALELLAGASAPATGAELVDAVLGHQRYNKKPGKLFGQPLPFWRDQGPSRHECCLAIKKLMEYAVDDHNQPQSWLLNPRRYDKLRGPLDKPAKRAALSDKECLAIFVALSNKSQEWADVARLQRVYGLRMWETNYLVVKPNPDRGNNLQLFVTKGKTHGSRGIKRTTEPRFLEAVPVAGQDFDLQGRLHRGELTFPVGDDGNPAEISGVNLGQYLRRLPMWMQLVETKARLGEELVPYCFRHSYSARCTELGIHTDNASAAMGHTAMVHQRVYRTATGKSVATDFDRARSLGPPPPQTNPELSK